MSCERVRHVRMRRATCARASCLPWARAECVLPRASACIPSVQKPLCAPTASPVPFSPSHVYAFTFTLNALYLDSRCAYLGACGPQRRNNRATFVFPRNPRVIENRHKVLYRFTAAKSACRKAAAVARVAGCAGAAVRREGPQNPRRPKSRPKREKYDPASEKGGASGSGGWPAR